MGGAKRFNIDVSPCRGCENVDRNKDERFEASGACTITCVDLGCWQAAIAKAEIIGITKQGACAICRRPSNEKYCESCRARVSDELARRTAPEPLPQSNFGPKKIKGQYAYELVVKKTKFAGCEICGEKITVGETAMCRNLSSCRRNLRYAHVKCVEQKQGGA